MSEQQESSEGSSGWEALAEKLDHATSPSVSGIVAILTAVVSVANPPLGVALAGMSAFGLTTWNERNQNRFVQKVQQELDSIDATKIDHLAVNSDEFIELIYQAVEAAAKTSSELKCNALANALLSSITMPTSKFVGKQALIRLITQMSNEEILALAVLSRLEDSIPHYTGEMPPPNAGVSKKFSGFQTAELSEELGWNESDTTAACEGLLQLGLVLDSMAGTMGHFGNQHQFWQSTVLGRRVQQFSLDHASTYD